MSIMCLWMFHFASCHEDAKNRELQRTYRIPVSCRTTSLGSVGQSRQLAATSPCSPQELSVGSSNKGDRSKISFDLRKRPCLSFSHSVLLCPCISFHFISWFLLPCHSWTVNLFAFTDSQVVSVLNKVMLEDRIAALKPPKPPLKPLVKESRDAELVCTNLPDMPGPWLDMESPWDEKFLLQNHFAQKATIGQFVGILPAGRGVKFGTCSMTCMHMYAHALTSSRSNLTFDMCNICLLISCIDQ